MPLAVVFKHIFTRADAVWIKEHYNCKKSRKNRFINSNISFSPYTHVHTHTYTHDITASFVIATPPPPSVPCCLCCIFISLKTIFPRDRKLSPRKINLLRMTRLVHRYEIKYRDRELKRFVFKISFCTY